MGTISAPSKTEVKKAGTLIGKRRFINFTSGTVMDDPAGDKIDITITGSEPAEQVFTASIPHLTGDAGAGKAFTIADFIQHGMIKEIKLRADFTAGQQSAGSALVNNASGALASFFVWNKSFVFSSVTMCSSAKSIASVLFRTMPISSSACMLSIVL